MSSSNIGTSIKRYEDLALLKGEGRFVDDIKIEGLLEVAFVRSPHPHAVIKSIDTGAARALDGVHAVYTHADLDAVLTSNVIPCDHKNWDFPETAKPLVLPSDEVCFAGEAIDGPSARRSPWRVLGGPGRLIHVAILICP